MLITDVLKFKSLVFSHTKSLRVYCLYDVNSIYGFSVINCDIKLSINKFNTINNIQINNLYLKKNIFSIVYQYVSV